MNIILVFLIPFIICILISIINGICKKSKADRLEREKNYKRCLSAGYKAMQAENRKPAKVADPPEIAQKNARKPGRPRKENGIEPEKTDNVPCFRSLPTSCTPEQFADCIK